MKLTSLSPAAERQERRDRLLRDRAMARALRDVYPGIGQLRLELRFHGSAASDPGPQAHTLPAPARAFFSFPCPYADCDGHFDLGTAAHAAVSAATHRAAGELHCAGSRSVGAGDKKACQVQLTYTITATVNAAD